MVRDKNCEQVLSSTLAPCWPLSIAACYQYDMAHGSGIVQARKEAENIIKMERELLNVPNGMPVVADIIAKSKE